MSFFTGLRFHRFRPRLVIAVLGLGLIAAALGYAILELRTPRPVAAFGQSHRERRVATLRSYVARGQLGSLVPQADAMLAIRQEFLQSVIDRSMPFRQYFERGRYVARLDRAVVELESGLALVTLEGRGMLAGQEDSPLHADFILRGLVTITGVDPDSGTLQGSIVITDVGEPTAHVRELQSLVNPVARYFGRLKADDWNRSRQLIHLPIRVDREIILPEVAGDVSLPETRIPVSVRVSEITTLDGRMAVSLALRPDAKSGEQESEVAAQWNPDRPASHRLSRWLQGLRPGRLRAEEESLAVQVARLARRDPLWQSAVATDHDVVAIVPAPVLRTLVTRVSRRYLKGVEVDLRPKAVVPLDLPLRVKVWGNKLGVGRLKGTIQIPHVNGRLSIAGDPRVTLSPPSELAISVPARVLAGQGSITLDLEWVPSMLVRAVCHGFRFNETLAGAILPFRDELTMGVQFSIRDSTMVGHPRVQRDTIRFSADLTDKSWGKVRDKLIEQDRFSRCGIAMNADSVLGQLQKLASGGIKIRLSAEMFKPFRLPVMLEQNYMAAGYRIEARTYDPEIAVEREHLRLAFRADLRVISAVDTLQNLPATSRIPRKKQGPMLAGNGSRPRPLLVRER